MSSEGRQVEQEGAFPTEDLRHVVAGVKEVLAVGAGGTLLPAKHVAGEVDRHGWVVELTDDNRVVVKHVRGYWDRRLRTADRVALMDRYADTLRAEGFTLNRLGTYVLEVVD